MNDDQGGIHEEHPFVPLPADRDPVRRLRGRLAAPVTIVTAGDEDDRVGLTVSSLVVAEGDPALVYMLIGVTTDLWYAIEETGRFVVHIAEAAGRALADVFAGARPAPGGPFFGLDTEQSEHGPVIASMPTRAFCSLVASRDESHSLLVTGTIDHIELSDVRDPLAYFRGRYRLLESP